MKDLGLDGHSGIGNSVNLLGVGLPSLQGLHGNWREKGEEGLKKVKGENKNSEKKRGCVES